MRESFLRMSSASKNYHMPQTKTCHSNMDTPSKVLNSDLQPRKCPEGTGGIMASSYLSLVLFFGVLLEALGTPDVNQTGI